MTMTRDSFIIHLRWNWKINLNESIWRGVRKFGGGYWKEVINLTDGCN